MTFIEACQNAYEKAVEAENKKGCISIIGIGFCSDEVECEILSTGYVSFIAYDVPLKDLTSDGWRVFDDE